jgi:hypothetical protein
MAQLTETSTLFLDTAQDLVERLGQTQGAGVAPLLHEAQDLVITLQGWARARPSAAEKVATIQRLFDLNRRAMDLLAKMGPPSSHTRPKMVDDDEDEVPSVRAIGSGRGRP